MPTLEIFAGGGEMGALMRAYDWSTTPLGDPETWCPTLQVMTSWLDRYIHREDQPAVTAAIAKSIDARSKFEMEHRVRRADGSIGWTFSRAVPMFDVNGEIVEWFGTATDVTARKVAEEALLRSEKLASLGRMAATTAHEINNPLEALGNLLFLAAKTENVPREAV